MSDAINERKRMLAIEVRELWLAGKTTIAELDRLIAVRLEIGLTRAQALRASWGIRPSAPNPFDPERVR
jgi:hypothetical protein